MAGESIQILCRYRVESVNDLRVSIRYYDRITQVGPLLEESR
jgi:hypothetical protein